MRRYRLGLLVVLVAGLCVMGCGATPTPTAIPTPEPLTVRVPVDGSGRYASLQEAVDAVPPGSTIVLEAGTYHLTQPLDVYRALKLLGVGMDQTEVISDAGGYVVHFAGPGPFAAQNVTFRHEGEVAADVLVVQGGEVDLRSCRFAGAWRASGEAARAGLRLLGQTSGLVEDCEFVDNASIGIWLADRAQPTLVRGLFTGNEMVGIAYQGDAGGMARHNECMGSRVAGIQVEGQAQPTLEENSCVGNGSGIVYLDEAGGTARGNECLVNGSSGISVGNQAGPVLEENLVNSNQYGIVFAGSEGGVARRNQISENTVGLLIGENAHPELVDNTIHDNDEGVRDLRP